MDDSFVLYNSWNQEAGEEDLPKRAGNTLAHAGVSVTVTSLTCKVTITFSRIHFKTF